jgi:hypothetical protein
MPSYYSRAKLVLCIGTFIEAFGNVPLEAAACGVPSIVSSVGANIGKLPPPFSYEVPPDDLDAAFDAACHALTTRVRLRDARQFLLEHYSMQTMLESYSTHITSQLRQPPLPLRLVDPFRDGVLFRQPAWCRNVAGGEYNDYAYEVSRQPDLIALYSPGILPADSTALDSRGFSNATLKDFVARGFLTYS